MNPSEIQNLIRFEEDFWWFRGMHPIAQDLLSPLRPSRILEAGCGTGAFTVRLARQFPDARIHAFDLLPQGLAARRALQPSLSLLQADLRQIPFPTATFDLAICLDVIVHFPRGEEHAPCAELARILQPGGHLLIRVSALDILRSRHSEFTQERQRFDRTRLRHSLEAAGLEVQYLTYLNSLLSPVALAKFRIWEPLTSAEPSSGVEPLPQWLNRSLERALQLERRWLGSGKRSFPFGQSLLCLAKKVC